MQLVEIDRHSYELYVIVSHNGTSKYSGGDIINGCYLYLKILPEELLGSVQCGHRTCITCCQMATYDLKQQK